MKKYIISPVTTFDEDENLYLTKVGLDEMHMPLLYIVFGRSEDESRSRAFQLVLLLEKK